MSKLSAHALASLGATAEVCGTQLSPAAAALMAQDLEAYPEPALLAALQRCRREVTGRLSLAAIIERIDDGRPTADEAWAQVGTDDESRTIVSTDEAMTALGEVRELLADDPVAARVAFKDAYRRVVTDARARGSVPVWFGSLGHDSAGRVVPIMQAVERGRLSEEKARRLLGGRSPSTLAAPVAGRLPGKVDEVGRKRIAGMLSGLVEKLTPSEEPAPLPAPAATGESQERRIAEFEERNRAAIG